MSHSSKPDARAQTLLETLVEDSLETPASEIREDISAAGDDPASIAADMRARALDLLVQSRKARLVHAQGQLRQAATRRGSVAPVRNAGRVREKLRALVSGNASFANGRLAVAFRNGVTQSDNDVLSLWQDLIDVGAVTDDDLQD